MSDLQQDDPSNPAGRLQSLDARIQAVETARAAAAKKDGATGAKLGVAMRFAADLVGGVVIGLLFGYLIDKYAHTAPFGMLVCLLLGFAAGIRNMVVTAARMRRGVAVGHPVADEPSETP